MGSRAGDREYGDTADGDERFVVRQVRRADQSGFDLLVSYEDFTSDPFSGVTRIVAEGGEGDDEIIVEDSVTADVEVELLGGAGNDILRMSGSGRARLRGDAGNDLLVGGRGEGNGLAAHGFTKG